MPSQPPVTVLHPARAEALLFAWRAYAVPAACVYVQPRQRYAPSGFDVMMRGAAAALVRHSLAFRSNVNVIKFVNIPNQEGSSRTEFPCNISAVKLVSAKKDFGTNCNKFPCRSIDLMPSQQDRSASMSLILFSPRFNSVIPFSSTTSEGTIVSPFLVRLMDLNPVDS